MQDLAQTVDCIRVIARTGVAGTVADGLEEVRQAAHSVGGQTRQLEAGGELGGGDVGVTLVAAVGILIGNLVADLITPLIDPRVRLR